MTQFSPRRSQPTMILLSLLLYRCLLRLGPAAFRRDYATPALQDFLHICRDAYQKQGALGALRLWPGLVGETVPALLAEYWTELFGRRRPMLPTIRRSMIATFWAFILFLFAYTAFGHTADPAAPFDAVGRVHPEIALTHTLVSYSGEIALLAIVLGGLPFLFMAVKQAMPGGPRSVAKLFLLQPKQALLLLGVALLITICALGFLLATQYIFGPPPCTPTNGCIAGQPPLLIAGSFAAIIAGLTLGLFFVLVIGTSLALAVSRSEFGTSLLRFALLPIGILALAMAVATIATAIWTIRLWVDAPQFAASGSGLGDAQTAWVIAMIVAMAASTVITAISFASSLRTRDLTDIHS